MMDWDDVVRRSLRHRRAIVFCAAEDRDKVAEACRILRGEGHEIVERVSEYLDPGAAYAVDADFLQHKPFDPSGLWS
jgi:hypothetical protein